MTTSRGYSALHEACQSGNTACVQLLLKAGCDVNLTDQCGQTPLFNLARSKFDMEAGLEMLLERGIDVQQLDVKGPDRFIVPRATAAL